MQPTQQLRSILAIQEYLNSYRGYAELAEKFASGHFRVEFGADDWPERWYTALAWENRSWPLIFSLMEQIQGINDFKLYYDRNEDFHHIEFTLEGERYDVQWYKVYSVTRLRDKQKNTLYYHDFQVVDFFRNNRHKRENWGFGNASSHQKN